MTYVSQFLKLNGKNDGRRGLGTAVRYLSRGAGRPEVSAVPSLFLRCVHPKRSRCCGSRAEQLVLFSKDGPDITQEIFPLPGVPKEYGPAREQRPEPPAGLRGEQDEGEPQEASL